MSEKHFPRGVTVQKKTQANIHNDTQGFEPFDLLDDYPLIAAQSSELYGFASLVTQSLHLLKREFR